MLNVLNHFFSLYILKHGPLPKQELTGLSPLSSSLPPLPPPLSLSLNAGIIGGLLCRSDIYVASGDLNSCPHTWAVKALPSSGHLSSPQYPFSVSFSYQTHFRVLPVLSLAKDTS